MHGFHNGPIAYFIGKKEELTSHVIKRGSRRWFETVDLEYDVFEFERLRQLVSVAGHGSVGLIDLMGEIKISSMNRELFLLQIPLSLQDSTFPYKCVGRSMFSIERGSQNMRGLLKERKKSI
jgi:hypothetical protein